MNTRSESLTIWQMAENPNVYVFDFPGLSYQGRSFNRITQFTEQQTTEPYPKVLSNAELSRFIEAALDVALRWRVPDDGPRAKALCSAKVPGCANRRNRVPVFEAHP